MEKVPGLYLVKDFITENEEENLIRLLDSKPWLTVLKRRVQQYGRSYDYSRKVLGTAPAIPQELKNLGSKIPHFDKEPDQVIVNEYKPGQGILAHTDHYRHFGPVVASISLGHEVPMIFRNDDEEVTVFLPRRSVVILTGDARRVWTHEIPARRKDNLPGAERVVERNRRISITYRTVVSEH